MSAKIKILYSTRNGQAKKIALYIAERIACTQSHSGDPLSEVRSEQEERRNPVVKGRDAEELIPQSRSRWIPGLLGMTACYEVREKCGLIKRNPFNDEKEKPLFIILIAAVRHGFHLPEAESFLKLYQNNFPDTSLALASINLTARKPNKDTVQGNVYLKKLIKRYRLSPILAAAFAGRLDYPKYNWIDRQMVRLIMKITGGPTDPTANVEYTDWKKVDEFADRILQLANERAALCRDANSSTNLN